MSLIPYGDSGVISSRSKQLAQMILDDKSWSDFPILVDSLEEDGYDTGVLNYWRDTSITDPFVIAILLEVVR